MGIKKYFVLLGLTLSCFIYFDIKDICPKKESMQLKIATQKQDGTWLTIFVHGSITPLLRPPGPLLMTRLIMDRLEGTRYLRATNIIRRDHFFMQDQPMQKVGLHKIDKNSSSSNPATIIARIFDTLDARIHGRNPEKNLYYTYGWSGIVGWKIRYNGTKQFYKDLSEKIQELNTQGIFPKIRIIGFCHGGSLGLNLALIRKNENPDFIFDVDELITIGMPINRTMNLPLHDPMFKKVYNIYSHNDIIQRLDLLAPGGLFSRRMFTPQKKKKLPQKLKQIRIKIMQNRPTKKTWPTDKDPRKQFDKPNILSGKSKLLKDVSPEHLEQWFFGWTDRGYRRTFPLYPLPLVSIVPVIIDKIDKYSDPESNNIIFDLRPDQGVTIVKNQNSSHTITSILPEKTTFSDILKSLPHPLPEKITSKKYWKQVNQAVKQAKQQKNIKKEVVISV
jgi:hypothetical protein